MVEVGWLFQTVSIGLAYIVISATLINFNKWMMRVDHFPHSLQLTTIHMIMTFILSLSFYSVAPSQYPTMNRAMEDLKCVLYYIAPLGVLFAVSLYCSNEAYVYSSVAFLQFCKEGNVALVFAMSCAVGLQMFTWHKAAVLSVVLAGCLICTTGEIHFVWAGLLLQVASQFAECSKNLIGETVMSGAGLKLDALTFVMFQAPCSLLPLLVATCVSWEPVIVDDFKKMWPYILANASVAFSLNVVIALTIKNLSTLAFVIIGLVKDMVIVLCSAVVFGDPISNQQRFGFPIIIFGIAMWSHLKMKEQSEVSKEVEPIAESIRAKKPQEIP